MPEVGARRVSRAPAAAKKERLFSSSGLLNSLALAALAGLAVASWLLFARGGWEYYRTPLAVRGYLAAHRFLRPSGPGGNVLGIVGTLFMFMTLLYVARKRMKILRNSGSILGWLEFHVFCGLFGPILITFHTSFKFNGLISVAYWSMVLVVLSGFVGRYLFVRIPKTIRGQELSRNEIEERVSELKARLAESTIPVSLLLKIEEAERAAVEGAGQQRTFLQLIGSELQARRRTAALRKEIRQSGLNRALLHETLDVVHERAILLQRIARLKRTRQLFQVWHVFHRPLVWLMFAIFFIHLGVAVYFGYTVFGR